MSLDDYKKKRRFQETPEPKAEASPGMGGRFCFQRHDARRLHYDLRLELNDVLLSWAVPKGPPLEALDKRLAVRTEDHPLKYLEWEGVIPEGNYGAGSMIVFDIGYWEPVTDLSPREAVEKGELKFRLWGQKVAGEFTLVSTKGSDWLLIKKKDAWCKPDWDPEEHLWSAVSGRTLAEVEEGLPAPLPTERDWPAKAKPAPLPLEIEPMLAHIGKPFDDPEWAFEVKWDGVRAIAYCQEQSLKLASRNGNSYLANFPELHQLRARMAAESFVLDGELVVLDEHGVSHFDRIAPRLRVEDLSTVYRLARTQRAVYYVFDLLYLDGMDLRNVSWLERRALLEETLRPDWWVRLSESLPGKGTDIFNLVVERGLEGLVAKKHSSPYLSGRSDCWLKLKLRHVTDCVVVGYTAPRGGRRGVGSIILARYEDGRLRFKGRVGSGLPSEEWKRRLEPLKVEEPPIEEDPKAKTSVTWCEPRYVVEVEHSRVTKDGHLFHPTFVRDRPELVPEDCSDEDVVGRTAFKQAGGKAVKISNSDKVLFPAAGATKADLANYYHTVAELILPHLKDRPLSLRRYPDGVDGPDFFQKRPGPGFPDYLTRDDKIYCHDEAGLLYLANLASVELHATLARHPTLDSPDGVLIDLDPQGECPFERIKDVALEVETILERLEWTAYVKSTGSRGLHVFIPLRSGYTFEQSRLVAQVIAEIVKKRLPDKVTLIRNPAKRPSTHVYMDAPQNREAATMASAFSARATPEGSVSVPLRWAELKSEMGPRDFTIKNAGEWLEGREALWSFQPDPEQTLEELLPRLETLM